MKKSGYIALIIMLVSFTAFCLLPVICLAAVPVTDATGTPLGQALADFFTNTLFPVINALLIGLIGWAVIKIGNKYKIDALIDAELMIQNAAAKGIALAEEMAAKKLKTANIKVSGNEKLDIAVAQVLQAAPKISRDQAQEYVEAILAKTKGTGATNEKTV